MEIAKCSFHLEGLPTVCAGGLEGPLVGKPRVSPQDGSFGTHHAHRQELDLDPQFHTIDRDKNDLGLKNFQSRYDWLLCPHH